MSTTSGKKAALFSPTQQAFMDMLVDHLQLKLQDFCRTKQVAIHHARKEIGELVKQGVIQKYGSTRGQYYALLT